MSTPPTERWPGQLALVAKLDQLIAWAEAEKAGTRGWAPSIALDEYKAIRRVLADGPPPTPGPRPPERVAFDAPVGGTFPSQPEARQEVWNRDMISNLWLALGDGDDPVPTEKAQKIVDAFKARMLRAAIGAATQAPVASRTDRPPSGWKLVPLEPTPAMTEAAAQLECMQTIDGVLGTYAARYSGKVVLPGLGDTQETCALAQCYRAMIAAAPPTAESEPAVVVTVSDSLPLGKDAREAAIEALRCTLPMAKAWAHAHPVGANAEIVKDAEIAIRALDALAQQGPYP